MLDLEVVPEQGLQTEQWELILGMHFSQAVAIIQSQVRVIRSANVVYNDQAPLDNDLILDLPGEGFRLMFDPKTQRLRLIEVYNLKLVRLKYCGTIFNSGDVSPTVEQIDRCFGATRPGSYDKERALFALHFRGLSFYFPVDLQYQPHYNHGLGSIRFPGDSSPLLHRMILYVGNNPGEPAVPILPSSCYKGHIYCEDCTILRNSAGTKTIGLRLRLYAQSNNALEPTRVNLEREIKFGDTAQSVVFKLGSPSRIFFKSEDKMKIHSKEAHKRVSNPKSDYFFNYFTLGIDIMFDSRSHKAIKFILHTNFPGHYDFNSYHRCPFSLSLKKTSQQNSVLMNSMSTTKNSKNNGNGNNKSPKAKKNKLSNNANANQSYSQNSTNNGIFEESWHTITYASHWEDVNDFSQRSTTERPVVLTRSSSNNPFGPSLCYGFQDLIFEVMSNDHIASVTLYQENA